MSFVGKAIGSITGANKAADAATQGAALTAAGQTEALNYLKQTEALPQELREGALTTLGGLYGLGGNPQDALAKITGSAAYQNVMSSLGAGEEAILRNASATGGLRSGNVNDALARYSGELQQQAFGQGLQGLQSLAQLPSNANNIANGMAGIGQTLGQGQVAAGQAQQAGRGLALSAAVGAFSDARLKTKVKKTGKRRGHNWYTWEWSEEAKELGLVGEDEGVMAHEIAETNPEAVRVINNYLTVDYSALGVQ